MSCGSVKVYVAPGEYSRKNPITLDAHTDACGVVGDLQFEMQSNGYKLISLTAAKKAVNFDSDTKDNSYHSERTATTTFKSAYIMEIDYDCFYDLPVYRMLRFKANITDLTNGEIVMTASYSGLKKTTRVVRKIVSEMNKVIK